MPPKPGFDDPFAGVDDKPIEAAGTLLWQHDHYYFEKETTQVRVMTEYIVNTKVSSAESQLSQALVGKRVTIRGKLLAFKCGGGIQLDDEEMVCLEQMHPKPIFKDPYPEMYDKRVEATGTLRFYHNPTPLDETTASQRVQTGLPLSLPAEPEHGRCPGTMQKLLLDLRGTCGHGGSSC